MYELNAVMEIDENGTVVDATNVYMNSKKELQTIRPDVNAVFTHLFREKDADGNMFIKRVVTICCLDPNMKDALMEEAHRILKL